jgi:FkbM family methyltransferase
MQFSPRRYAQMIKRAGRLIAGRDVLYRYNVHPRKTTLGTVYGGWTIAPEYVIPNGVMYSFGVGNDITFDESVIARFQLEVHGFDPSPHIIDWIRNRSQSPKYVFHPYGLGDVDGTLSFFSPAQSGGTYSTNSQHENVNGIEVKLPVKRLETITKELKTDCIQILKMDVEGAEYSLLSSITNCPIPIKQLLIEFHHRIGIESLQATIDAVDLLRKNGYLLFHVSETSSEFSFLHSSCIT